jgi:hypothetical protein
LFWLGPTNQRFNTTAALIANSGSVFALALFSHLCNWLFIAKVEKYALSLSLPSLLPS